MTYNEYVTKEAEKQWRDGSAFREGGIIVYKVRRPLPGEEVMHYTNFSSCIIPPSDQEVWRSTDKGEGGEKT